MKQIKLVGYGTGNGSGNFGCAQGPFHLQHSPKFQQLNHIFNVVWGKIVAPFEAELPPSHLPTITMLLKELSEEVHNVLKQDNFFITIGGDHSSGIGSWSAAAATYREQGDIGLIWFDAHLDAHTYETTPSGNIHGMPVACLLGYGKDELTSIMYPGAKIKPENLVFVGARSYEQGEHDLLQDLGVKIYYMDEINQRGLAPIFEEAKAQVKRNTVAYGLSLDLDGIDPEQAPGVGTPAANGVDAQELITALECFAYDPKLIGAELVEFNPNLDSDSKTENIVLALLEQLYRSQERVIF